MIYLTAYLVFGAALGAADIHFVQRRWFPKDTLVDDLKGMALWMAIWPLVLLCRAFG
jgi:hypothetical protein